MWGGTQKGLMGYQGLATDDQLQNNTTVKLLDLKDKEDLLMFSMQNYEISYKSNRIRWALAFPESQGILEQHFQETSVKKCKSQYPIWPTSFSMFQVQEHGSSVALWWPCTYFSTRATRARFNCSLTQILAEYPLETWKDATSCKVPSDGSFPLISCGGQVGCLSGQTTSRQFPLSPWFWWGLEISTLPPPPRMQLQATKLLDGDTELAPSRQSKPPFVFSCHLIPPVWCLATGSWMWGADNIPHLLMLCV